VKTVYQEEIAMIYEVLPDGDKVPVLGQGTWGLGGGMRPDPSRDEIARQAIRDAIEFGYTHIDTAEMYGDGHTEELVGDVIADYRRQDLFITSKVWRITNDPDQTRQALHGSLARLNTDYLDLYLIHRPNMGAPLEAAFEALNEAVEGGIVRHIGVSNFNLEQLKRAQAVADTPIVTNQVPYNLKRRTYVVNGVLEYCQDYDILLTAYSPIDRGHLIDDPTLNWIAGRYNATPAQIALNWLVRQPYVIAIPMSTQRAHLEENLGALELELSEEDVERLNHLEMPEEDLFPE